MSPPDEPNIAVDADQPGQWPPPIAFEDESALPPQPQLKAAVMRAAMWSTVDTAALIVLWEFLVIQLNHLGLGLRSNRSMYEILALIIPSLIGLAASYRWRLVGLRIGRFCGLIFAVIVILPISGIAIDYWSEHPWAALDLPYFWAQLVSMLRLPPILMINAPLVAASLIGRAWFARNRAAPAVEGDAL